MKYTCVAALVLLLAVSSFGRDYQREFVDFMHTYQKSYAHDEFFHRFAVFKANLDMIDAHNAQGKSWTLGVNKFADLTGAEFKKYYTGYKAPTIRAIHGVKLNTENLADSVDWSTVGATTLVKDQGQCGSCWSFSSTGALEGLFYLKNGHSLSKIESSSSDWTKQGFAEQQLVDCSQSAGDNGCEGGLMDYAFTWVGQNGITLESKYPYTAQDGSCQQQTGEYMKGITYTDVSPSDEDALKAAVAQQPVSVAIEADQSVFQFYTSGVINDAAGCGTQLDHGVLAVGYGHDASSGLDYWKVKNSWGASWGDKGFVLLARGSGSGNPGMCGIAMQPSYPQN